MVLQLQVWAMMLLQEGGGGGGISFDPRAMWGQMGWLARFVVVALFIMSAWSIGVMIDRAMAFNAARKQFPTVLFAGMFGFAQDRPFFDVGADDRASMTAAAPQVKFGT